MPERVSPGRTTWVAVRTERPAAPDLEAGPVRGTDRCVPSTRKWPSPEMRLRVSRTPTVVRWAMAMSLRVSPSRTVSTCQPWGAESARLKTTAGVACAASGEAVGGRAVTRLMAGLLSNQCDAVDGEDRREH